MINPIGPAAALLMSAALPPSHGAGGAQQAGETEILEVETDRAERMTVPVRIGGAGPFRFVIDTGSESTVLSTALARELSLDPSGRARVVGLAGTKTVDTVQVDDFSLGRGSRDGLVAPLLERINIGADGIVGIDSLQDQRVMIDFTRNLMAIDDHRDSTSRKGFEIVVRARRHGGQLIMTEATINGIRTDVVIDTGAEASVGNRALQKALARRNELEPVVLHTVTGQTAIADVVLARRLTIDHIYIEKPVLAFIDSPTFAVLNLEHRPALLLGMREMRAFERVAIDFPNRKVMFDLPRLRHERRF